MSATVVNEVLLYEIHQ